MGKTRKAGALSKEVRGAHDTVQSIEVTVAGAPLRSVQRCSQGCPWPFHSTARGATACTPHEKPQNNGGNVRPVPAQFTAPHGPMLTRTQPGSEHNDVPTAGKAHRFETARQRRWHTEETRREGGTGTAPHASRQRPHDSTANMNDERAKPTIRNLPASACWQSRGGQHSDVTRHPRTHVVPCETGWNHGGRQSQQTAQLNHWWDWGWQRQKLGRIAQGHEPSRTHTYKKTVY